MSPINLPTKNPTAIPDTLVAEMRDKYTADEIEMVRLAFDFADNAHRGQKRLSGEPYITHPLAVAKKLVEMRLDAPTIIAGLLHDVPEDTAVTLAEVEKNFGREVAKLVGGITKLGKIKYRGIERYSENLRKMFIAMSDDLRVVLIKFADRLHNLQTLGALPPDKQQRIARESLEIYGPIADRLGMGKIKGEIEDAAFRYVYPEEYLWVADNLPKNYRHREKTLERVKKILMEKLVQAGIRPNDFYVHGRKKQLYSLYKKLLKPGVDRDFNKVYDLSALRIIVPTVIDCYTSLGIIHQYFRPVSDRIKDYIAQPKPNGYQSLHTTVFDDNGEILEIQIRTPEMHEEAEFGVAAHWHYKEKGSVVKPKNIKWLEDLIKWQKEIKDNEQFIKDIKLDIFQDRIFVFSPRGDAFDLPENSTPIDFAYHVHTSLGNQCVSARVNGQMVNLNYKLKSGDTVEIITDKNRKSPSFDWLEHVKTAAAREKIKAAINRLKKTSRN